LQLGSVIPGEDHLTPFSRALVKAKTKLPWQSRDALPTSPDCSACSQKPVQTCGNVFQKGFSPPWV